MKYLLSIAFVVALVWGMAGCRATKKIQTAISKKDTAQTVMVNADSSSRADSIRFIDQAMQQVRSNRIDFRTFSAKIKVDYWDKDGKGPDLTVFLRMKKDSLIWLAVNATIFNVEAFRVLITRDSVKVLNRRDRQVQLRSLAYLQEVSKLPFDFSTLQDLLVGNPIYVDSNVISYRKNGNQLLVTSVGQLFKNLLTIRTDRYVVEHSKLDDVSVSRARTGDLTWDSYADWQGKAFPTFRRISFSEKSKLDVEMNFKQYDFNNELAFPFVIPKNYKRL